MRTFLLTLLLLLAAQTAVHAQFLQLDVIYTEGHIVSGPLSADLTELPASVHASFLLNGAGAGFYATGDVLQSSLVFGDGSWNAGDLIEFSATLLATDSGGIIPQSLSYSYAAKNTPKTNGKLAANFPLTIEGTDIDSGLEFHYQYDTSNQTVSLVPEPAGLILALAPAAAMGVFHSRRRQR